MDNNNQILSICIPTYNRKECIKEQIIRINNLEDKYRQLIWLFVSDNCSTDGTDEILHSLIDEGYNFTLNRNDTNLGSDKNFEICFKAAKTKYAWILGDDDFIISEKLPQLLQLLASNDYGLVHLGINRYNSTYSNDYYDANKQIQDIGIWITFMSSNIINNSLINKYQFDKYYGTYFIQVPYYLKIALSSSRNVIVNERVFENGAVAASNGGYNIFEVFVNNLLSIFTEYMKYGISVYTYRRIKKEIFDFIAPHFINILQRKNTRFISENALGIMLKNYWLTPYFYCFWFLLLLKLPSKIIRKYSVKSV